jgi:hypothetical protein
MSGLSPVWEQGECGGCSGEGKVGAVNLGSSGFILLCLECLMMLQEQLKEVEAKYHSNE